MQDVTRLRALEGELARTIQMMRSVKAARAHVALADEGSFRRERQPSSASVMIRLAPTAATIGRLARRSAIWSHQRFPD
jgi:flagellar M-ring protein FliF